MAAAAPSTRAPNPLAQSLAAITGEDALSASTGTSPIDYENGGFRPGGDIIEITGNPGTGATTAETWGHEIELEKLKNVQAQFAYEQQQNILENARAQAQLQLQQQQYSSTLAEQQRQFQLQQAAAGLQQQQYGSTLAEQQRQYELQQTQLGMQQAEAARAAQLAPLQLTSAQLANQQSTLDIAKKQYDYDQLMAGQAAQAKAVAAQAPMWEQIARDNAAVIGGAYSPQQAMAQGTYKAAPVAPKTNYGYVGY